MKLIFSNKQTHHTVDADGKTYGELCQEIASRLMRKNDMFASCKHEDTVTVSNLYKFRLSYNHKLDSILFHNHSGYKGGLRTRSLRQYVDNKLVEQCIRKSIRGMMGKTKQSNRQISALKFTE